MTTAPLPDCPTGRPWYPGRHAALRAGWEAVAAVGRTDLTPSAWRCRDGCGGGHVEILDRSQVAARLEATGRTYTAEDLVPARKGAPLTDASLAVPLYEACPECGAGWGNPHYERCGMTVPVYDRDLTQPDVTVITMFAISIFPLDVMRRATIRAMLPRGDKIRLWFGRALKWAEEYGYVERGPDYIRVLQREPMVVFAGRRLRDDQPLVEQIWLAIAKVAAALPPEITPEGRAQRARELAALRQLMEAHPAGGAGRVRIVPRPGRP